MPRKVDSGVLSLDDSFVMNATDQANTLEEAHTYLSFAASLVIHYLSGPVLAFQTSGSGRLGVAGFLARLEDGRDWLFGLRDDRIPSVRAFVLLGQDGCANLGWRLKAEEDAFSRGSDCKSMRCMACDC